jgi:hypothetical protein
LEWWEVVVGEVVVVVMPASIKCGLCKG